MAIQSNPDEERIRADINEWIDETLRYNGESLFDIQMSDFKATVTLRDGSRHWFFFSLSNEPDRVQIVGEIQTWLMDRT